jgi:hypothetical protein
MSQRNLTRWIEDAEARQVREAAMFDHGWAMAKNPTG